VDAVVYGVNVPHYDGRAGMAALVVGDNFDLVRFRSRLTRLLPDYARPVFLRIVAALELTGTFKLRKHDLAAQGFDPRSIADAVFLDNKTRQAYERLDEGLYARISTGAVRL
jgi:fatty-acyl-CoA synthase